MSRSRKKILICCPIRGAGGIETHVIRLAATLSEQGAEVTVASRIVHPAAPIHWFRKNATFRFFQAPFAWTLPRVAMAWAAYIWPRILPRDFDVLLTFDLSHLVAKLRPVVKPSGYVIACRVGAVPPGGYADAQAERFFNGFITETQTQLLEYKIPVPKRAIPLIALRPVPLPRSGRSASDAVRVAYMGRYDETKGILKLVDIWKATMPENAELTFYGIGPDREKLECYITAAGITAAVNDGWKTPAEQAAVFVKVDLLLLWSADYEGFPVVLMEALGHGVPFIATDVGAVRELANGNTNVAVVPQDERLFIHKLRDMITRIRSGDISSEQLRKIYRDRYESDEVAARWRAALLEPEITWGQH